MKVHVARAVALVLAGLIAGCGGGASSLPTTGGGSPGSPSSPQSASAKFTITLPLKSSQQSTRGPKYISASTQSVIITLTSVNGSPYSATASAPASLATNLTTSSPSCSISGSNLVCTAAATAIVGTDIYTVTMYDATQASATPATPAGTVLSQGTATLSIIAGQANTGSLTLNPVVGSVTASFATNAHVSGSQAAGFTVVGNQPRTFTVAALDPDGNTIVGPGAPTFAVTSGSAAVTIASTATAGTYTAQVQSYSSTPVVITVTPSSGTAITFNVTAVQEAWVASSSANTISGFNASTYAQFSGDTITAGLNAPFMVQTGPNGDLWISNYSGNSIEEVVPETNTALLSISGAISGIGGPFGISFDGSGNLYLSNGQTTVNDVAKFTASSFAGLTGAQDIAPAATTTANVSDPVQSGFDASGILWVAGDTLDGVSGYDSNLNNVALIEGPVTQLVAPTGVCFDGAGHLWVADDLSSALYEFNTAGLNLTNGDIAPSVTVAGGSTGLSLPVGCAFDAGGNLWVASRNASVVTEYASSQLSSGGNISPVKTLTGLSGAGGVTFTP